MLLPRDFQPWCALQTDDEAAVGVGPFRYGCGLSPTGAAWFDFWEVALIRFAISLTV